MRIAKKEIVFESELLKDNPLGDPYKRKVVVLEPEKSEGVPIMFFLSGFGGSSLSLLNYDPLGEGLDLKAERLMKKGLLKGSVMVFPDMFTYVGGNQYLNSTAVGNYESFLIKELMPFFKEKYASDRVAVLGKSSGGYGAITLAMKHREISAAVDHSGDAYFEYCYLFDIPAAYKEISKYGSAEKWLSKYWKKENKHLPQDMPALNIVGMSAFYSPKGKEIQLPFDLETGELDKKAWNKWLEKDPVRMVDLYSDNLRRLRFLMIDVGNHDEYNLNFGNRILHKKLLEHGVKHFFEEFEGGHSGIGYRYDTSMPLVEKALYSDEA